MKILLLGSSGLLGTLIKKFLEGNEKYQLQDYSKQTESSKYDFSKKINLFCIADSFKPEVIINAIGLTNVDYCERNPHEAFVINARVVENISQWIIEKSPKTHLIHISTDHLYDSNICHKESDIKLSNYYAFSKYIGELFAEKCGATVLRTNFFGIGLHPTRLSFTDWIFNSIKKNQNINVLTDIFFNPVSFETLIKIIDLCIVKKPEGIFNVGSMGLMSKAEFAVFFATKVDLPLNLIERKSSMDVSVFEAYRPKNMHMNSEKIIKVLNIKIPSLEEEIISVSKLYI